MRSLSVFTSISLMCSSVGASELAEPASSAGDKIVLGGEYEWNNGGAGTFRLAHTSD
jgi:hypothetical protein